MKLAMLVILAALGGTAHADDRAPVDPYAGPYAGRLLAGYGAGLIANWLALRWTPETGPRRRPRTNGDR